MTTAGLSAAACCATSIGLVLLGNWFENIFMSIPASSAYFSKLPLMVLDTTSDVSAVVYTTDSPSESTSLSTPRYVSGCSSVSTNAHSSCFQTSHGPLTAKYSRSATISPSSAGAVTDRPAPITATMVAAST